MIVAMLGALVFFICEVGMFIALKECDDKKKKKVKIVKVRKHLRNKYIIGWRGNTMFVFDEHGVCVSKLSVKESDGVWTIKNLFDGSYLSKEEFDELFLRYSTEVLISEANGKITIG
jgi:hypothetical protein